MARFKTYGHIFDVPDKYAEGHVLTANEAAALNGLRAEMISHKVRSFLVRKGGADATEADFAAAENTAAEEAKTYEFGAARGGGGGGGRSTLTPEEKEARAIAREAVLDALKRKNLTVAKKDVEPAEGQVSYERFAGKVLEVAQDPKVVARAKKVVAARNVDSPVGDIEV